jgi:DNA (cytosine-5)-methyltransferase 1
MEIVGQVEIDDYCQKILKLRWPDVPKWKDIREVNTDELPRADVISGGFPCTDISIANNDPEGIAGARSGLWGDQFRIIRSLRPRYAIVENVSALLGRGLGKVIGDLASIGFDAEWQVIPASWFGAFHRRERVWILAYPKSERREAVAFHGKVFEESRIPKPKLWKQFQSIPAGAYQINERWKEYQDIVCGDDDGDAYALDRLQILGNGQIPQTLFWIGKRIMEYEGL